MTAALKDCTELESIFRIIKWSSIEKYLLDLDGNQDEYTSLIEDSPYAAIVLFRALLLQKWYNLSEVQLVHQLRRDLVFRSFVGLRLNEAAPGVEAILRFRKKISEKDLFLRLANRLHLSLLKAGFLLKSGQLNIIDVSFVGQQEGLEDAKKKIRIEGGRNSQTPKQVVRQGEKYDKPTRAFHWLFAFAIIYLTLSGYALLWVSTFSDSLHDSLAHFNVSLATVLALLFPIRVIWAHFRNELPPVQGTSTQQHQIAKFAHSLIYKSIGVVLITGYFMIPDGYRFFGLFRIPTPFYKGDATEFFFMAHRVSCAFLALLVTFHVLAVIQHYVFHRVNILRRMT